MKRNIYEPKKGELFHIHTWRCKHAGAEQDYEYVEKAISLGAPRIVFTDHCPFPGNPFGNRMDIEMLPEYVDTIKGLAKKYADRIEVFCGLEIEYLPSFKDYYRELRESGDFDLLMLGQHFFEYEDGHFDYSDIDRTYAYIGLCNATVEGINTGLFDVVAHPDRAFRKKESFDASARESAEKVIAAAVRAGLYMEKNLASMEKKNYYWQEFWNMLPKNAKVLYGLDAHLVDQMIDRGEKLHKLK